MNSRNILYIDPVKTLGEYLLTIDKPSRYVGGEVGCLCRKEEEFKTVIAFPDLYEIGMGNHALRIIYNSLNNIQGVCCDRAFAPAPDFEKLLREKNLPLYGLDTGIALSYADLLMFTVGYELGLNGILTMLDVSGVPLRCDKRNSEEYPIVIAGGPAISNPRPFSPFIDAFWIGDAEAGFFELVFELAKLKKEGKGREALLEKIASHSSTLVTGKKKALRAIMKDFSKSASCVYPVPSMKIVHHHGTVEIMRGCPNGCRFCHAGFWYRPYRQKDQQMILSHVDETVTKGGWQEVSLSSLSSGDYSNLGTLIETMNQLFKGSHISFQLPSLKVSGFSLSLLEKISVTRKSGLTFAIETPLDIWQASINKEVTKDNILSIINEAGKSGWKGVKFYFMIGLPLPAESPSEEEEIVLFVTDIGRRTRMHFNININVYIPKPHTPYQRASQLDSVSAEKKICYIRSKLKPLGHKVSSCDFLVTRIEGLLSRGDEKAGLLCEKAWKEGSRLDPWSEYIDREKWSEILEDSSAYTDSIFSGEFFKNKELPWSCVDSCVTYEYINNEALKSINHERTSSCKEKCGNCGVCGKEIKPIDNFVNQRFTIVNKKNEENADLIKNKEPSIYRMLFSFKKEGNAVFHGHLSLIEIFSMSFRRARIPLIYTKGFNPLAKIEIVSPLSTGISADNEIAAADFNDPFPADFFLESLNNCFPEGIRIKKAEMFLIKSGIKKYSLSSLLWGFSYSGINGTDYVNFKDEKKYRKFRLDSDCKSLFFLKRNEVLAVNYINNTDKKNEWMSYFDIYKHFYPEI